MKYAILKHDPYLMPFEKDIALRMDNFYKKKEPNKSNFQK